MTMLLADLDLGQIIIIVVAVVVGFLQWLWKLIKQGQEERAQRHAVPEDPEVKRLRDEAWRRQVQPTPSATPPPLSDPWGTVREVFDKMKEEMRKAQEEQTRPSLPPPLPRPVTAPPVPAAHRPVRVELSPQTQRPAVLQIQPPVAPSLPVLPVPATSVVYRKPTAEFSALRTLLLHPASLR
ncbi:MAG: hypothetical protein U0984_15090, partial [Prosthecobacter sp.]|nr:hypothetical protein [Prosthecobacter sp.]